MKRLHLLLALGVALLAGIVPALAAPPAQPAVPQITTFTTGAAAVHRDALEARTARVPIAWAVENRPPTANLQFDQVLPDGDAINVELPRADLWVESAGEGVAAPILPPGNPADITLRARLVDLESGEVYAEQQVTVPITTEGEAEAGVVERPALLEFSTCCPTVIQPELEAGAAQVPVVWRTANRLPTTNLAFEQVLPDGSVVNVELPRDDPLLPDAGEGVVAPVWPGEDVGTVLLRARLFDVDTGRVYDRRDLLITIDNPEPPSIVSFTTTAPAVHVDALANRSARVPVAWAVENRPPHSHLLFEQVLAGDNVVNIELPRAVMSVPSTGEGVIAPIAPGGDAAEVVLRLRLIDLGNGATLAQRDLALPVTAEPLGDPEIISFETTLGAINAVDLEAGGVRVPIFWQVNNRPDNSNLVFEQVLPDGRVINVELPRPNPIVPTAGAGAVTPVNPGEVEALVLRVRLVDLGTSETLAQRELTLPITR